MECLEQNRIIANTKEPSRDYKKYWEFQPTECRDKNAAWLRAALLLEACSSRHWQSKVAWKFDKIWNTWNHVNLWNWPLCWSGRICVWEWLKLRQSNINLHYTLGLHFLLSRTSQAKLAAVKFIFIACLSLVLASPILSYFALYVILCYIFVLAVFSTCLLFDSRLMHWPHFGIELAIWTSAPVEGLQERACLQVWMRCWLNWCSAK